MCSVIIVLMILLNYTIFAAKIPITITTESAKPVSISFFIDDENERFGSVKFVAITKEFARTLSNKASLVTIVSNYVLKNMVLRKYTKNPDKFLNSLNLDLSDWDIYHVNNTHFFVFIPLGYDSPILNKTLWTKIDFLKDDEYNGDESEDFPTIPWADGIPVGAKRLLSHGNMKYITYAKDAASIIKNMKAKEKNAHKKFDASQLPLIFKSVEDYEQLNLSQPCNIFMNGHGYYSPSVNFGIKIKPEEALVAGMSVEDFVNTLLFFNDKLNTKSVRLLSCYSGGKILDLIRIKNYVPIRIKYLFIVDSLTDAPSYDVFSDKLTAHKGLDLKGYFEALDIFQDTSESFKEEIEVIKSKATVLTEIIQPKFEKLEQDRGFNGVLKKILLPRAWYFSHGALNNFPQVLIPEIGWFQTFNVAPFVRKITDASMITALVRPEFFEKEKVEIEDTRQEQLQTKNITIKNRLKKIVLTDFGSIQISKALALLVSSEIVFVNLNIIPNPGLRSEFLYVNDSTRWLLNLYKYFSSISSAEVVYTVKQVKKNLCVYPQFVSMQRGDSLNLFAKINILNTGEPITETGILNFLRDAFLILRNRKSEKVFFIKELEGFNDFSQILDNKDVFKKFLSSKKLEKKQIILQNVLVRTSRENLLTEIGISFNFGGKYWHLDYCAKNLNLVFATLPADKSQSLWRFKEDKFAVKKDLQLLNLTYLAELSSQEYYAHLRAIRDLFHYSSTGMKMQDSSSALSFKEFIASLDPAVVQAAIEKKTDATASDWASFEQLENQSKLRENLRAQTQLELGLEGQYRLQLKLKNIKSSLRILKQKCLMLSSKLRELKKCLGDIV